MKISIVIVNYNVKYYLEQCLCSVKNAISGLEAEVFVVDNHSTDGSMEYLKPRFPEVTFIENCDNPGFACANNQAIARSSGEYILLLNPDTVVGEESLRTLVFFMDEHPEAGAAGVKMLDGHGVFLPESKRSFPTPWVSFCKIFGLTKIRPGSRVFSRYNLPYLDENEQHEVDVLAGAFMMLRREALDKAGLLDESFFMYGEDIDLSYRIQAAGYKNYYIPERLLHYKGESTRYADLSYVKSFYGAMLIFYRKYYPHSGWWMRLLIAVAVFFRAIIAFLFPRRTKKPHRIKHRRLLVFCYEEHLPEVKSICLKRMPELEFVNLWNLNEEHVMSAFCRRNQMKCFTDYVFCIPDVRFEQVLLMMDKSPNKKITYHVYNRDTQQIIG